MSPTTVELIAAILFAAAIAHTFATPFFERLAHARPAHAGLWGLLGEVEVVFGFWALVLFLAILAVAGMAEAVRYVDMRDFTEPLYQYANIDNPASRPVLQAAAALLGGLARSLPLAGAGAYYLCVLALVPLLGSFITEPAAMTLAALILSERVFAHAVSVRLKYATLGVLFVNVSIGGTLTPFAAPPVLMVAGTWGWDTAFMLGAFGWKAALAVAVNALGVTMLFRRELARLPAPPAASAAPVPLALTAVHLAFLAAVVAGAHHPPIFIGALLLFLGVAHAYQQHQDRLILREAMLVAFFLAGLVVLGGQQQWWLEPILMSMSERAVFFGATVLTAFTDNAALTYLGSLVEGLSDGFKYALVAGAVTGGGLTVIANAPNPAGLAILRGHFADGAVSPLGLLLAALPPTLVAALAFLLL